MHLRNVAIIHDQSAYPGIQIGSALSLSGTGTFSLTDSNLTHLGNCASQWPHNTAVYCSGSADVMLLRNVYSNGCPGYAISSCTRVHIADSTFRSVGDVSQGQGFNGMDSRK